MKHFWRRHWSLASGGAGLTRSLLHERVVVEEPTAGADGDVVETPRDQGVEDAFGTGPGH